MSKTSKIQDFRKLNLSNTKTPSTPIVSYTKRNGRKKQIKKGAISMRPKESNQKTKKRKKEKKNYTGITVFFILLIIMGVFVGCLFTPTFNIAGIRVESGKYLKREQILAKMIGAEGINILKVNTTKLAKSIEELPYIKSAEVKRYFPDELKVIYTEREPYALIRYLESFVVMDKYGYVLEIIKENTREDLPILYAIDAEEYILGQVLTNEYKLKYDNAVYLLETAKQGEFAYTIYEINYEDSENVKIAIKEMQIDINYGNIDRNVLNDKIIYLNGILKKLDGKKGSIDISSDRYQEKTIFVEKF